MASGITLQSTNNSVVNIKNIGTTTNTTEVIVPNRNMIMGSEITLGVAQATTSGTFKDFTISSGVKRVTVMLNGVSTNGTSNIMVQLGYSGGIEATGYLSTSSTIGGTVATIQNTTGFVAYTASASATNHGHITICKIDGNSFTCSGNLIRSEGANTTLVGGSKTLSGELTTVRITTVNSTDTFDAGLVNVSWEY